LDLLPTFLGELKFYTLPLGGLVYTISVS